MLNVVDTNSEGIAASKKRAVHTLRIFEIHRDFGEEVAVGETLCAAVGSLIQSPVVDALKQVFHFGQSLHAPNHIFRRHNHFQLRGRVNCRVRNLGQVARNIVKAKAEVTRLRLVNRQLVQSVLHPMIVMLPILLAKKIQHGALDELKQLNVFGDCIKAQQPEKCLAVVESYDKIFSDSEVANVEGLGEIAFGLLHGEDAASNGIHQWNISLRTAYRRPLAERQQRKPAYPAGCRSTFAEIRRILAV